MCERARESKKGLQQYERVCCGGGGDSANERARGNFPQNLLVLRKSQSHSKSKSEKTCLVLKYHSVVKKVCRQKRWSTASQLNVRRQPHISVVEKKEEVQAMPEEACHLEDQLRVVGKTSQD